MSPKLSPLIGNMIEFSIVSLLNARRWPVSGQWLRQDPGFPDVIFSGAASPQPGIEIKTWFPLAPEITARFKESVSRFETDHTYIAVIAWVPEYLIYGKPRILDAWCVSARELAQARDEHYHQPPDYLVFEPRDTRNRTVNLRQTNTNGYRFQGTQQELERARLEVASWKSDERKYSFLPDYQEKLEDLRRRYPYRSDTNFAKIDRVRHVGLEAFKSKVLQSEVLGRPISAWRGGGMLNDEALSSLL